MAHVQTTHGKLNKPQDLINDKVSSQKMFIDNIDTLEDFITDTMGMMSNQVADITTLKAIDTTDITIFGDGKLINVISSGIYQFRRGSVIVGDDNFVVQPTVGGGRWILYDDIYELAGGTGTAITLNNVVKLNRRPKTFIVSANNNGAATTINTSPLYKAGTVIPPTIKAGKAVTVWYDTAGSCFFLKASAEGNAIAAHVLAPYFFSNDDDTGIPGTMVDNGPTVNTTVNLTTEGAEYIIPVGYHTGLRKIKAVIAGLLASVVKSGTTVGGILGTYTSDATAVDADVLATKSYYRNGVKGTGNMVNRSVANQAAIDSTYADGLVYLLPPAGYYNGAGYWVYLTDPDFTPSSFLSTKNIFGQQGNIPVHSGSQTNTGINAYDGQLYFKAPVGYYDGSIYVVANDPDFSPANILNIANPFGLQGTAVARGYASSTVVVSGSPEIFTTLSGGTTNNYFVQVSGLSFTPTIVVIEFTHPDTKVYRTIAFNSSHGIYANMCLMFHTMASGDPGSNTAYTIKSDVAPAYINGTGFKLPVIIGGGVTYTWKVWK